MLKEHECILRCCKFSPSGEDIERIKEIPFFSFNWSSVIWELGRQQVLPLVYFNLNRIIQDKKLDFTLPAVLKNKYYSTAAVNMKLWQEYRSINELCIQRKIRIVGLRGIIFSYTLYPVNALRNLRDIDILVQEKDIFSIRDILILNGYRHVPSPGFFAYDIKNECGTNFVKNCGAINIILNVHWSLASRRPYSLFLPELWGRVKEIKIDNVVVSVLSAEDNVLSLALHLRRHCRSLCLKYIFDIKEVIEKEKDIDWDYIYKYSRINHIRNTVYFSLYMCRTLFNTMNIENQVIRFNPGALRKKLIRLIINKENYFYHNSFKGIMLRLLLFDRVIDIVVYLFRVSFIERLVYNKLFTAGFLRKLFSKRTKS